MEKPSKLGYAVGDGLSDSDQSNALVLTIKSRQKQMLNDWQKKEDFDNGMPGTASGAGNGSRGS